MTITDKHLALAAEHDALKAKCADMEKSLSEAQVALAAKDVEIAAVKAAADKAVAEAGEKLGAAEAQAKAEQELHAATKAELDKARLALANPAFADAAIVGAAKATPEGGAEAARKMTREEALAEYQKIEGAVARAKYREAHAEELGLR